MVSEVAVTRFTAAKNQRKEQPLFTHHIRKWSFICSLCFIGFYVPCTFPSHALLQGFKIALLFSAYVLQGSS